MNINMTDDQLRAILVEALFEKISPEDRGKMITAALTALMEPQANPDKYSSRKLPSKLQDATEDALLKVARTVIAEELAKTEVKEQIRALAAEAIQKVFGEEMRETTTTQMARALSNAMLRSS